MAREFKGKIELDSVNRSRTGMRFLPTRRPMVRRPAIEGDDMCDDAGSARGCGYGGHAIVDGIGAGLSRARFIAAIARC